ncbi:sensor histidine kinase [Flindersiella endophytica]
MRRPWTLRARLVVALVALAAVGLTAVGAASVWLLQRSLIARVDEQLMGVGREWLRPAAIRPRPGDFFGGVRPGSGGPRVPTDFRIVLLNNRGEQVSSFGRPADEGGPALPLLNRSAVADRGGLPFTVPDTNGDGRWRVRALAGDGSRATAGPNRTAVVAMSLDTVDATVDRLLVIELVVGVLVLVGLGGLTLWVVRMGIRPLTRIEQTAEAIAGGDLDRRVEGADRRTETGRVATALNTMVGRLGAALRQRTESEGRLRRFVGDASHELRTPLTSIRGFAELYRKGGARSKADVDRMMGQIETEAVRMGRLVDDLLLLARLDSERPLDLTEVDLGVLAADAVHDVRQLSRSGADGSAGNGEGERADVSGDGDGDGDGREIVLTAEPGIHLLADAGRLRQVVTNLLTNAVRHTPPGTTIAVTVRAGGLAVAPAWEPVSPATERLTPASPQPPRDRREPVSATQQPAPDKPQGQDPGRRPDRSGGQQQPERPRTGGRGGEPVSPADQRLTPASLHSPGDGREPVSQGAEPPAPASLPPPGDGWEPVSAAGQPAPAGPQTRDAGQLAGARGGQPPAGPSPVGRSGGEPVSWGAESGLAGPPASWAGRQLPPGTPVAVLEVTDAGPGIPLDQAPYVFDRFYRADPSRARKGGGTGLGLAITAAIVEAHQGCVELYTAPGKGARFRVILPLGASMSAWQR